MTAIQDKSTFSNSALIIDDTLVVSDLHIGYPREKRAVTSIEKRLQELFDSHNCQELVLNGDVFHDFPLYEHGISMFKNLKQQNNINIEYVVGNHEEKIGGVKQADVPFATTVQNEYLFSNNSNTINICHGHKTPTNPADVFIIGHVHPQVKQNGILQPCVLYKENAYHNSNVIILPSFGGLSSQDEYTTIPTSHAPILNEGSNITKYSVLQTF